MSCGVDLEGTLFSLFKGKSGRERERVFRVDNRAIHLLEGEQISGPNIQEGEEESRAVFGSEKC